MKKTDDKLENVNRTLTLQEKATNNETYKHIFEVERLMQSVLCQLQERMTSHDQSKLELPEVSIFTKYTPKLKGTTYGSEKYKQHLKEMGVALDHHYERNRHHPEHQKLWRCPVCQSIFDESEAKEYSSSAESGLDTYRFCTKCTPYEGDLTEIILKPYVGIEGMTLVDLIEMLCDWVAATLRHADGNIEESFKHNRERFGISEQLITIFRNTVREYLQER